MASPVGHALVGVGLAAVSVPLLGVTPGPALWIGAVIASGAPDLDFVGVLLGYELDRVHRRATHSLFVLSALAALALFASTLPWALFDTPTVWVWAIALLSHPLVDTLITKNEEGGSNWGIPLFWPFWSRRFCLPRPLVPSPDVKSYASLALLRDLLPELALFGSTCLSLVLLGSML
jgi:membrane-bound metal-dependent hydrolase YbcI (DUF457 family)